MQNYKISAKEIAELESLMSCKIKTINSNKFILISKSGKEYSQTAYDLLEKLNYQRKKVVAEQKQPYFKLIKLTNPKLRGRKWKSVSCSMTLDEIKVLDEIKEMNCYNTLNEMFRDILLKVIATNK